LNKLPMLEIYVNLTCIKWVTVYSQHKNTCLLRTQKMIPRRFCLDMFYCNKESLWSLLTNCIIATLLCLFQARTYSHL
jgi:hypothetical protein